mgnify:CR=1 FL=1
MNDHPHSDQQQAGAEPPWYRQFWPWFIIALPAAVVVASFFTLWLAISNPDPLVVDEDEYRQLKSELKAQPVKQKEPAEEPDKPEDPSN